LRVEERGAVEAGPGHVAVGIEFGGICGSDLHYYRDGGVGDFRIREPLVLGHEVVGRVSADADGFAAGTAVGIHPATPCGSCAECVRDHRNICAYSNYLGSAARDPHIQGGFVQELIVPVEQVRVSARVRRGLLHHVVLHLSGDGFTAIGSMNRMSGSTQERLDVSGADSRREVLNLAEIVDHKGQPSVRRRGDWVPVARQRGIEQITLAFLDAVRGGKPLDARDALRTHELCERIVAEISG